MWVEQCRRLLTLFAFFSLGTTALAREQWVTLKDCRYLPNPANDGDSFHVRAGGREYIFRLYFVDAPETEASLPARVKKQAKYFHLSVAQTLQIGLEAERFTREKLAHPFTVHTCKRDARGRSQLPRYFAYIQTDTFDLAEQLVANGLARVYGAASDAPGMNTPEIEWRKLKQLESKAKEQKIGGWGVAAGRLNTRAATQPRSSADSFAALFHPNAPGTETAARATQQSAPGVKLDVNNARIEALRDIPGIGVVLAKRIIDARPFQSADDLQQVKGIGVKRYEQVRPYFQ